jgi:hypothetical protein
MNRAPLSPQSQQRNANRRLALLLAVLAFCFYLAVIMTRVTA